MTQTIIAVVTAAQLGIKTSITKIQNTPSYAVYATVQIPTTLVHADNIKLLLNSSGYKQVVFDLTVDVMVPTGNMESAMNWLADIPQAIGDVFRGDVTIGGTCQTYNGDVTAKFIIDDSINAVGYKFTVPAIKIDG